MVMIQRTMAMAMMTVKIANDGNGDDDDDDDGIAGKPGCVTNKPKRHHNG